MMTEGLFLRAIHDEPDEPAHRLVFADWLAENGDPGRAEHVRVEVKLEQLGDQVFEGADLVAYSEYLYVAPGDRRGEAIAARYGEAAHRSGFGVPARVHVEGEGPVDAAALAPPLRGLTVVSNGAGVELLSRPELAGVTD